MSSRRFFHQAIATFFFLLITLHSLAAPIGEREYKIKTAFMLNFFKFTQWQSLRENQNFLFCTSDQAFAAIAQAALKDKKVHGHKIQIIFLSPAQEQECHALFITKDDTLEWQQHLVPSRHSNTLIIGEDPKFSHDFGHIRFVRVNNKLRFQINLAKLKQAHLKMSPQLLRLALVSPRHQQTGEQQ